MKRFLLLGGPLLLVGALVLGWMLYSRSQADAEFQKQQQQKELEKAERFRKAYGSDEVKIIGVKANPPEIRRGQMTVFCYGVLNAKVVKLDPPVEPVHPAPNYCFELSPAQTTTYTITAEDENGKSVQQATTVVVR